MENNEYLYSSSVNMTEEILSKGYKRLLRKNTIIFIIGFKFIG